MRKTGVLVLLCAAVTASAVFLACGSGSETSSEQESNPPGDIPDNQIFVSYHSDAGGYSLDVPEGWARKESGPNVSFVEKLDSITVEVIPNSTAPTVDSVTATDLPRLAGQVEAFEKVEVKAVDLPAGKAVRIRYRADSAPDSVTGKKVRLEIDRYELFKDGKVAAISLSAPAGADNVDVWKQISSSFKWE